jgi:hypothetical protein
VDGLEALLISSLARFELEDVRAVYDVLQSINCQQSEDRMLQLNLSLIQMDSWVLDNLLLDISFYNFPHFVVEVGF